MSSLDPIDQFQTHWSEAKAAEDPNADFCFLATASAKPDVSVRALVLRAVEDRAFILFVNSASPKWRDLMETGAYELLVFWPSSMRQYRVRGTLELLPREQLETHWQRRPYASKLLDHFYSETQPQSSPIATRNVLVDGIQTLKDSYPDPSDVPCPDSARGLRLEARQIESWTAAKDRLHHRHLYTLHEDGRWQQQTLVP